MSWPFRVGDPVLVRARKAAASPRFGGVTVCVTDTKTSHYNIEVHDESVVPAGARVHPGLSDGIDACVAALARAEDLGHPLPHYVLAALHELKAACLR